MAKALYLEDAYLKEFDATVESVKDDKYVVLDQTAFYPNGGGQPFDTGKIIRSGDGKEFSVVFTGKFDGNISHEVDSPGLKQGDKVRGIVDWERRYKLMKSHTTAHIISSLLFREFGAKITGNQLETDKIRIDFDLEQFDRLALEKVAEKCNQIIKDDKAIKAYWLPREEVLKDESMQKLAKGLLDLKEFRIVEIEGVDRQADGGTHVKSTGEIGTIRFLKAENKGKSNRRAYYAVE